MTCNDDSLTFDKDLREQDGRHIGIMHCMHPAQLSSVNNSSKILVSARLNAANLAR